MKSPLLIAAAVLCAGTVTASHASSEEEPAVNCKFPVGTYEENYCASKRYESADTELNAVYRQLRDKLSSKEKSRLAQLESKWVVLRDATCEFETMSARQGTGWSGFYSDCLARLTKNRIIDLKTALEYRQ